MARVRVARGKHLPPGRLVPCAFAAGFVGLLAWPVALDRQLARDQALCAAIRQCDRLAVERALARGADVNARCGERTSYLEQMRDRLLLRKSEPRVPNPALSEAFFIGRPDIPQLLVLKGARVNERDETGGTLLMHVAPGGGPELLDLLIAKGIPVNARDKNGLTALMLASAAGLEDNVQVLLDRGADVNARDVKGQTALDIAEQCDHPAVIRLLKQAGARP